MKQIIDEYIKAYNEFNVDEMLRNVHEDVELKSTTNGEVNVQLKGITTLSWTFTSPFVVLLSSTSSWT
jgi:hypothetical protein